MSKTPNMKRRQFLAGAVAAGPPSQWPCGRRDAPSPRRPLPGQIEVRHYRAKPADRRRHPATPAEVQQLVTGGKGFGGDFMVDCMKAAGYRLCRLLPGLHVPRLAGIDRQLRDEFVKPEFITCIHEEASVAMAHGYSKIAGKPLASMVHGVVGLQHSSMAIYNCYLPIRSPVVVLAGNVGQGTQRRPGVEWAHSAHDQGIIVRDFVKWDDQAENLQDFGEGLVRAYDLATTAPMGPVLCVIDADQQEEEIEPGRKLFIPKLRSRSQPTADPNALAVAAKLLAAAENPVIVTGRYTRTEAGPKHLVQLAELLQAPVLDERNRMNMPSRHPLNHTLQRAAGRPDPPAADVVLALEPMDLPIPARSTMSMI